jgi:hypothetical protein
MKYLQFPGCLEGAGVAPAFSMLKVPLFCTRLASTSAGLSVTSWLVSGLPLNISLCLEAREPPFQIAWPQQFLPFLAVDLGFRGTPLLQRLGPWRKPQDSNQRREDLW